MTEWSNLEAWQRAEAELAKREVHDLRSPLAAIKLNMGTLAAMLPPTAPNATVLHEVISDIVMSVQALEAQIDNREARARLENPGEHPPARSAIVLGEVVQKVVARLQVTAQSTNNVTLTARVEGDARIVGDDKLVTVLVDNLARNGITYASRRRPRLAELSVTTEGERCVLVLTDTGPAFGPMERDFSREGQTVLSTDHESRYGRSLGLYLIGTIAKASNAELTVGTQDDRTMIRVSFPSVAR